MSPRVRGWMSSSAQAREWGCRGPACSASFDWSPTRASSTAATAWQQVEEWLDRDGAWVPEAGSRHRQVLASVLSRVTVSGNLVPDAHLAALAMEHGLAVASTDGDFARFPDIRWINPLDAS